METIKKWFHSSLVAHVNVVKKRLNVLIVNRRSSRSITNAENLGRGLSSFLKDRGHLSNYTVVADLLDFSSKDQWSVFTSSDVIVSMDGAQFTNLFFAKRCSIVIEIFYPGYFNFGYFS